ncbi:hypothetical protein [Rhodovulum visakhapatnamense]|uniref:Uncharacterized protein n=1 Tax=Rhodovulum visakhapatnamense TaxID=364297 RepID=A0A4V6QAW2_9RHOB|nr:hypothetical protein [Rhodovulum visakhapatnamense]TDX32520.1 hypothetical protein EV657_10391 [Rhodovulum visakhapatnamense]
MRIDGAKTAGLAAATSPKPSTGAATAQAQAGSGGQSAASPAAQEAFRSPVAPRAPTTDAARDMWAAAPGPAPDGADGIGTAPATEATTGTGQQTEIPAPVGRAAPAAPPREAPPNEAPPNEAQSREAPREGGPIPHARHRQDREADAEDASERPSQPAFAEAASDAPAAPDKTAPAASATPRTAARQSAARRLVPALVGTRIGGSDSARVTPETLDRIAAQLTSVPPPEISAALASGGGAARAAAQGLRQAALDHPGGTAQILAGLAPEDIARLIAALLPEGAQALSDAVAALERTARDPVSARRAVARPP